MKVLIVDDEPSIVNLIRMNLKLEGYDTVCAYTGREAVEAYAAQRPDIVLLDIMLPDMDGYDVLRAIQELDRSAAVIFITANDKRTSKILGLELGADDYITKPFRPRELVARIQAALRKSGRAASVFTLDGLQVDTASGLVKKEGGEVFLSALEYRLLLVFLNNAGNIVTRDILLHELWDASGEFVNDNTLSVYIKRLREKIEDNPADPKIILTVRGTGYRLGDEHASE